MDKEQLRKMRAEYHPSVHPRDPEYEKERRVLQDRQQEVGPMLPWIWRAIILCWLWIGLMIAVILIVLGV